jgi:hypothetical protein
MADALPYVDKDNRQEGLYVSAPWSTKALIDALVLSSGTPDAVLAIRRKSRDAIEKYRAAFGEPTVPFQIETLASLLGIEVTQQRPLHSKDAELMPVEGGRVAIRVNPDRPETRRRFSIGHEIAHTFFPNYEGKAWCRTDARYRRRDNPDEYLEMLCDIGSAELLMPSPWFPAHAARVSAAAELLQLAQTYGVSREAMLRRFAESHSGAAAAVFFSWKLKPTQQKTVGLRDQGRLFGDPIEEARRAKKLRVDYSIPSAKFAAVGYFIPSDKSVDGEGPLHAAASSGTPCDGVSQLDFGGATGRFRVLALPVWTADPDLGPAGQNGVAAIIEPLDRKSNRASADRRAGLFDYS